MWNLDTLARHTRRFHGYFPEEPESARPHLIPRGRLTQILLWMAAIYYRRASHADSYGSHGISYKLFAKNVNCFCVCVRNGIVTLQEISHPIFSVHVCYIWATFGPFVLLASLVTFCALQLHQLPIILFSVAVQMLKKQCINLSSAGMRSPHFLLGLRPLLQGLKNSDSNSSP